MTTCVKNVNLTFVLKVISFTLHLLKVKHVKPDKRVFVGHHTLYRAGEEQTEMADMTGNGSSFTTIKRRKKCIWIREAFRIKTIVGKGKSALV